MKGEELFNSLERWGIFLKKGKKSVTERIYRRKTVVQRVVEEGRICYNSSKMVMVLKHTIFIQL